MVKIGKKKERILIIAAALFLLLISFFINNKAAFLFANARNYFFDIALNWITNFGSLFFVLFLIPTLFSLREKKYNHVFYLWISFLFSVIISLLLKFIFASPRPLEGNFIGILNYSFHSMHALVAFAALPILDKEFRKLRVFWILFAFFVAVSRLYFNYHYLSDVVGGAFIGYAAGLMFLNLEQKYNIFKKVYKK